VPVRTEFSVAFRRAESRRSRATRGGSFLQGFASNAAGGLASVLTGGKSTSSPLGEIGGYMSSRGILILAVILVTSCVASSKPIGLEEFPCVYEFVNVDSSSVTSRQILEIRDNGSYSNIFTKDDHVLWSYEATWTVDSLPPGYEGIQFENFRFDMNRYLQCIGNCGVEPKRWGRSIALCFGDPDTNNYCFVRKKKSRRPVRKEASGGGKRLQDGRYFRLRMLGMPA
jgi:hypothetical protein